MSETVETKGFRNRVDLAWSKLLLRLELEYKDSKRPEAAMVPMILNLVTQLTGGSVAPVLGKTDEEAYAQYLKLLAWLQGLGEWANEDN